MIELRGRMRGRRALVWMLAAGMVWSAVAGAHGARGEVYTGDVRAVTFAYSVGEPMAAADVRVYAPGADAPHQAGRTDAAGQFAFVPDRPGTWRVEARDGRGHVVDMTVPVGGSVGSTADQTAAQSTSHHDQGHGHGGRWLVWLLVVSLLVNVGLIWRAFRPR